LPFIVWCVVPWLLHPNESRFHIDAIPLLAIGVVCSILVTIGLYRFSPNPMYLAVCCESARPQDSV
jgi:hypothetical protein